MLAIIAGIEDGASASPVAPSRPASFSPATDTVSAPKVLTVDSLFNEMDLDKSGSIAMGEVIQFMGPRQHVPVGSGGHGDLVSKIEPLIAEDPDGVLDRFELEAVLTLAVESEWQEETDENGYIMYRHTDTEERRAKVPQVEDWLNTRLQSWPYADGQARQGQVEDGGMLSVDTVFAEMDNERSSRRQGVAGLQPVASATPPHAVQQIPVPHVPVGAQAAVAADAIFQGQSTTTFDTLFDEIDLDQSGSISIGEVADWWSMQPETQRQDLEGIDTLANLEELFGDMSADHQLTRAQLAIVLQLLLENEYRAVVDPTSGRRFFQHKVSGQTLWVLPTLASWLEKRWPDFSTMPP